MAALDLDDAAATFVAEASRLTDSRKSGGLALDVGPVIEIFFSGLFFQVADHLLNSATDYTIKAILSHPLVEQLRQSVIESLHRPPSTALTLKKTAILRHDTISLLMRYGYSEETSKKIAAILLAHADDVRRRLQHEE